MRIALLAPLLAGCQLVIGDIELPTLVTADGGQTGDAWVADAAPPDAWADDAAIVDMAPRVDADAPDMTPVDQGVVDQGWDMAPPVDMGPGDLGIDAGVDMYVPVPTALTDLAGTWHLYGIRGREQALSVFSAALRVSAEGEAVLTEIGAEEPLSEVPTLFDPHPDGTARISINLFPRAGRLAGMMDPEGGIAVFVNDGEFGDTTPTLVLGSRINAVNLLPPRSLMLSVVGEPGPGARNGGVLERAGMGEAYRFIDRVRSEGEMQSMPGDVALDSAFNRDGRLRLTNAEGGIDVQLSPAAGAFGGVGVGGDPADPDQLVAIWQSNAGVFTAGRFWCAGNALDGDGNHRTLSAFATLEEDGEMRFDSGARAMLNHDGGDAFLLQGRMNFFGDSDIFATIDPSQRAMLLVDSGPAGLDWGVGFCVTLAPAAE